MKVQSINLEEKFSKFSTHWTPKIIGELNGQYLKLAKVKNDFVWHSHAHEDELFFVVKGTLIMEYRDQPTTRTGPGEILIIPKGVEHLPRTEDEEVWLMLCEPKTTKHTGAVEHEKTVKNLEWI